MFRAPLLLFFLLRLAAWEGIVVDEAGHPIAGARVIVAGQVPVEGDVPPPSVVITGADGRFRMAAPPYAGAMGLIAYKDGFAPGENEAAGFPVAIVLSKGFEIGGTVRDAAGHPLAGAAMTAWPSWSSPFGAVDPALTDDKGRFSTRLSEGKWQLTFSKKGYVQHVEPYVDVTAATKTLDATLEPAATIRGRVVRKDGSGVDGARILIDNFERVKTAADGSFTLPDVPVGPQVIEYEAPGGASGSMTITAPADGVRLVLDDVAVRGRVVDTSGAPVTSFRVDVATKVELWQGARQFSDAEGRFVWHDAPAGDEIKVLVLADGFVSESKRGLVIDPAAGEITFTLRRARALRGKVVSTAGEPLVDVDIVDPKDDDEETIAKTNADGAYEIGGLDRGPASFVVKKRGFVPVALDVPPGEGDVTTNVQLRRGIVLTGRVLTPEGRPFAGAAVAANSRTAETGADGRFRLEDLPPGRCDVTASTRYLPSLLPPEEWLEGMLPDVDVERAGEITIRTKRRNATIYGDITGIDRGSVRIYARAGEQASLAENDGEMPMKYRMTTAPIGTVTVHATALVAGVPRATKPVVVEVAPNGEVRADLHFPEVFPIRGVVRENGEPVHFAVVQFFDESNEHQTVPVGTDGTYKAQLPAGRYEISVGSYSIRRAIAGPETIDIDVDLARIAVTVLDAATGQPIDDAIVGARKAAADPVTVTTEETNANGEAALDVPHGVEAIVVEKRGYGTAVVAAGAPSLLVKLTPVVETAVRIVDASDGRPLSGSAAAYDENGRVIGSAGRTADGKIYFRLAPGRYRFTASARGRASQTITADVPSPEIRIALSTER